MESKEMKKKWYAVSQETFESFIKENVGYESGPREDIPKCFGTGNAKPWCSICAFKPSC